MDMSGSSRPYGISSRKCVRTEGAAKVGVALPTPSPPDLSPAPHGQVIDLANYHITPFKQLSKPIAGMKRSRPSTSVGAVDPGVVDSKRSRRHEDRADVYDHQIAIQRKQKLLRLECSDTQEVPSSPSLAQLTESCDIGFLSPSHKQKRSSVEMATPLNFLSRAADTLPLPYDYHKHSAPRTLRSSRVKRALDFSSLVEDRVPRTDSCQSHHLLDNDSGIPQHVIPNLTGGSNYVNHSHGLNISTLIGQQAVILPDRHGEVPNQVLRENGPSDRLDVNNFSLLRCIPREE